MKTRLRKIWDNLQSSYWFVPSLMMVMAVILWAGTHSLDHRLSDAGKLPVRWLYADDVEALRKLLLTITGTMVGIVGVVFSILMVPLTIAASQFGPRLLRTFLRDTGTHITLGTFLATILFCVLVLLQLRNDSSQLVPQVSATTGLLLGLISFGMLIYFINHVAVSIQASVVVAEVNKELHQAIEHAFPVASTDNASLLPTDKVKVKPQPPQMPAHQVIAGKSGYVQGRDEEELMRIATEHNLVIQLLSRPGDFVVQHTTLARIWPDTSTSGAVNTAINDAYILGLQRTLVQDVTFGIHELVEVATRALSPGINDPYTAMTCLDWLGTALCRLCMCVFPHPGIYDVQGNLRLLTNPITFTCLTDAAFNQIRDYGRTSTAVTLRMLDTIAVVAQCARTEEQRNILLHHATLVERGCHTGLPEKADREVVYERFRQVVQLLDRELKQDQMQAF